MERRARIQTTIVGLRLKPSTVPIPANPNVTAKFKTATRGIVTIPNTKAREANRAAKGRKKREKTTCAPLKIISPKNPRKKNRLALPFLADKKIKTKTKTAKIKKSVRVK